MAVIRQLKGRKEGVCMYDCVCVCVCVCVHKLVELHRLEPKINDKLNSFPTAHLQKVHVARSILFVVALACTFRWLN